MTSIAKLERTAAVILADLDRLIATADNRHQIQLRVESVSGWSVAEQLEHLMVSDRTILRRLDEMLDGTITSTGGAPTLVGRAVLTMGFIPRGKGKAPKATVPGILGADEILAGLSSVQSRFEAMQASLPRISVSKLTFEHPALGAFSGTQWLQFVHIHHRHHEKIIHDIIAAAG